MEIKCFKVFPEIDTIISAWRPYNRLAIDLTVMLGQIQAPVRALAAVLDLASELTYCVYDKNAPREMADKRVSVIGVCLSVCQRCGALIPAT